MQKRITILGSTGSIGRNTLEVIRKNPEYFEVVGLSCNENIELFQKQIEEFKPKIAAVCSEKAGKTLIEKTEVKLLYGENSINEIVKSFNTDLVLVAIVGLTALLPAYSALSTTKILALANKEILVVAGDLIKKEAKKTGCKLIPVDSEHSAIFQLLYLNNIKKLERIILTASGGPFSNYKEDSLKSVSIESVLKHPTWKMGPKVTVDSATMMNKGLEIIEASILFDLECNKIDVLIHPESIIHGMTEFTDGSMLAHMCLPDMRIPISFAMYYPEKSDFVFSKLSLTELNSLHFREVSGIFSKSIALARFVLNKGKSAPLIYNGANEVAVLNFLKGKISFLDIFTIVEKAVEKINPILATTISEMIEFDEEVRKITNEYVTQLP